VANEIEIVTPVAPRCVSNMPGNRVAVTLRYKTDAGGPNPLPLPIEPQPPANTHRLTVRIYRGNAVIGGPTTMDVPVTGGNWSANQVLNVPVNGGPHLQVDIVSQLHLLAGNMLLDTYTDGRFGIMAACPVAPTTGGGMQPTGTATAAVVSAEYLPAELNLELQFVPSDPYRLVYLIVERHRDLGGGETRFIQIEHIEFADFWVGIQTYKASFPNPRLPFQTDLKFFGYFLYVKNDGTVVYRSDSTEVAPLGP